LEVDALAEDEFEGSEASGYFSASQMTGDMGAEAFWLFPSRKKP
jgi:hypothetical protein